MKMSSAEAKEIIGESTLEELKAKLNSGELPDNIMVHYVISEIRHGVSKDEDNYLPFIDGDTFESRDGVTDVSTSIDKYLYE